MFLCFIISPSAREDKGRAGHRLSRPMRGKSKASIGVARAAPETERPVERA